MISLASENGFPTWVGLATVLRGWAVGMQGQAEQGIDEMRQMLEAIRAAGVELLVPWHLQLLAEVYGRAGLPQEGLTVIAEAVDLMERTG